MILLDQNNTAVHTDVLGLDAERAWGRNWFDYSYNTGNATLVDVALPPGFKAGQFDLVEGVLVPNAVYVPPVLDRDDLAAKIDAAVAAITARYAPFLEEYKTREAQARAFAAADFTGPVPQQVAAFATPAGLSAQVATQTIIAQADGLRTASDLLGVQRMRKYEVLRAATDAQALAAHAEVMATIAAIGAQIG